MSNNTFNSFDNAPLFYREWQPSAPANGHILLLLHRGHEHSQRLDAIAKKPEFAAYKIYSYDNRGHGYTLTKATDEFMNLVRDLDSFVSFVCQKEEVETDSLFIIANSVAGVVASTWVHDYAPKIAGMVLIAPAFKIKLYFPFAKAFLKLALLFKKNLNIKSYVKSTFLTHDVDEQKKYNQDALITPHIPARQLTTLLDTGERIVADAALIATPTLILSATNDYVVDSKIQGDFYANLASNHKKWVSLEGFYHGILYEKEQQKAIDEIAHFMTSCFELEDHVIINKMIDFTKQEQDKLAYGSLPLLNKVNYICQRNMMNSLGRLSKGIQIGLEYGFDSGVTLDHVYKNEPSGKFLLGKIIDKNYLQSIGWRGIRQRKIHLIQAIEEKINLLETQGVEVRILDIAGGPARYLIEIAKKYQNIQIQVRDYQQQNITEGKALAKKHHLTHIEYQQADAFDWKKENQDKYTPNIIIISGLFELFHDNVLISKAIKGVASIIEDNGFLIYTNQPWHPQLELIANVLSNHQNKKWIMRRRAQYELDSLFALKGFKKEKMQIDNWGIFTVSSAQYNKQSHV